MLSVKMEWKGGLRFEGTSAFGLNMVTDAAEEAGRDPADHVILQAHPGLVDAVLVGGRFVKRNGRLVADLEPVRRRIAETTEHVARTIEAAGGFGGPDRSAGWNGCNERNGWNGRNPSEETR